MIGFCCASAEGAKNPVMHPAMANETAAASAANRRRDI
jgi:hypothetical protein